jgi:hypothetical protein
MFPVKYGQAYKWYLNKREDDGLMSRVVTVICHCHKQLDLTKSAKTAVKESHVPSFLTRTR